MLTEQTNPLHSTNKVVDEKEEESRYQARLYGVDVSIVKEIKDAKSKQTFHNAWMYFKAVHMFRGDEGLEAMLKAKWAGMGIVCALILTITIPMALEPPSSIKVGSATGDTFQLFMIFSSVFSLLCIICSTFWLDFLDTLCPAFSDKFFFIELDHAQLPISFLALTVLFAVLGWGVCLFQQLSIGAIIVVSLFFIICVAWYAYVHMSILAALAKNNGIYEKLEKSKEK